MHSVALKEAKEVMSKLPPPASLPPSRPLEVSTKSPELPPGIPEMPFRFARSASPVSASGWIMSVEHEEGSHKPILKDNYRKSIFERPHIPVAEKEGYLLKMKAHSRFGHNVYSKYYFITKGHYLEYYNDNEDAREDKFPIGVYDLSQVSSVTIDHHESRKAHLKTHFIITFQNGEKKNLKSAFKSEDDVKSWVDALRERVTFYHASKLGKSNSLADNVMADGAVDVLRPRFFHFDGTFLTTFDDKPVKSPVDMRELVSLRVPSTSVQAKNYKGSFDLVMKDKTLSIIPSANKKMQSQADQLRSHCKNFLEQRKKDKTLMQECEEQARRIEKMREARARDETEIAEQREEIADRDELRRELDAATLRNELDTKHHEEIMEAEKQRSKADLASVRQDLIRREHAAEARDHEHEEEALRRLRSNYENIEAKERAQARIEIEKFEHERNMLQQNEHRLADLEMDMEKEQIHANAKMSEAQSRALNLQQEIEHIQVAARAEIENARVQMRLHDEENLVRQRDLISQKDALKNRLDQVEARCEAFQNASEDMKLRARTVSGELEDTLRSLRQSREQGDRVSAEMYVKSFLRVSLFLSLFLSLYRAYTQCIHTYTHTLTSISYYRYEMRQGQSEIMTDISKLREARDELRQELNSAYMNQARLKKEHDSELRDRQESVNDSLSSLRQKNEEYESRIRRGSVEIRDLMEKLETARREVDFRGEERAQDVQKMIEYEDECERERKHVVEAEESKAELNRNLRRASNARREIEAHFQKQSRLMSEENERLVRDLDNRNNEYNRAITLAEERLQVMKDDENTIEMKSKIHGAEHLKQTENLNRMTHDRDEALSKLQKYQKSLEEERERLSEISGRESEVLRRARETESVLASRSETLANELEIEHTKQDEATRVQRERADEMEHVIKSLRDEMRTRDEQCASQETKLEMKHETIESECERLKQLGRMLDITESEMAKKEQDILMTQSRDYDIKEQSLVKSRDRLRSELESKTLSYNDQIVSEERSCKSLSDRLGEMREEIQNQKNEDASLKEKAIQAGREYANEMGVVENLRRARDVTRREIEIAERTRREMESRFEAQRERLREENEVSTKAIRRKSMFIKERAAETRHEISHLENDMRDIVEELRRERERNRASHNELDTYVNVYFNVIEINGTEMLLIHQHTHTHIHIHTYRCERTHLEEKKRLIDLETSRRELRSEWLEACENQVRYDRERAIQEERFRSQNESLRNMSTRVESMRTEMESVSSENKMLSLQVRRDALIREINAAKHTRESLEKIKSNLVVAANKGINITGVSSLQDSKLRHEGEEEDEKKGGEEEEKKIHKKKVVSRKFTIPELRLPEDLDTWSDAKIVKFMSRALNEIRVHHVHFCKLLVHNLQREITIMDNYPLLTRNLLMISASGEIMMELVSRRPHNQFTYLAAVLLYGPFQTYDSIVIQLKEAMTVDTLSPASAGVLNFMSYLFSKTKECLERLVKENHDVRKTRITSLQLKQIVRFLRQNLEDGVFPVDDIFERSIIFLGRNHFMKNMKLALYRDRTNDTVQMEKTCTMYLKESYGFLSRLGDLLADDDDDQEGWSSDSDEDEIETNVVSKYLNLGRAAQMTRRRADHESWKRETSMRRGTYFGYRPGNRVRAEDDRRPRHRV